MRAVTVEPRQVAQWPSVPTCVNESPLSCRGSPLALITSQPGARFLKGHCSCQSPPSLSSTIRYPSIHYTPVLTIHKRVESVSERFLIRIPEPARWKNLPFCT